jgi:NitT/TauT family transport system permease protein
MNSFTPAASTSAVDPDFMTKRPTPLWRRWLHLNHGKIRSVALAIASLSAVVFLWNVLSTHHVNLYVRFANVPSPSDVLASATRAFRNPEFAYHILISSRRIATGFALATLIAVPLGLLMGRYQTLRQIVVPVTEVLRPIPAIAWVPMAIMLWPTSEESIVFITFVGSFFPILINTLHGVASVDPVLVRAARSLGATEAAVFREVFLPASLPQIFTGLTVGMGVAWVSLIAAEMISGQFGIGYFTWQAYSLVQYDDIALGMITIGVLGLASSSIVSAIGHACMPWRQAR